LFDFVSYFLAWYKNEKKIFSQHYIVMQRSLMPSVTLVSDLFFWGLSNFIHNRAPLGLVGVSGGGPSVLRG